MYDKTKMYAFIVFVTLDVLSYVNEDIILSHVMSFIQITFRKQ